MTFVGSGGGLFYLIPGILFPNGPLSFYCCDVLYNLTLSFSVSGLCLWTRPLCLSSPIPWNLGVLPSTRVLTGSFRDSLAGEVCGHGCSPVENPMFPGGGSTDVPGTWKGEQGMFLESCLVDSICFRALVASRKDTKSKKMSASLQKPGSTEGC